MTQKQVALTLVLFLLAALVIIFIVNRPVRLSDDGTVEPSGISPLATTVRNLWGASANEKVDLNIYRSDKAIGWSWSRQNPLLRPGIAYVQPIYPNARISLKPSVAVKDISSFYLISDFHYTQPPTGKYNMAYDVFLREQGTNIPKVEIMVWLDWTQTQPQPYMEGLCSDGYNVYRKYWWTRADGYLYRSFLLVPSLNANTHTVNLKALIDLIEPEESWHISEVELGTEVWDGSGAVELTTYYLKLGIR